MFQPQDERKKFTVGDNSTQIAGVFGNNYWNRPLTPGVRHQVILVAVNQQDNEFKYSTAKLQHYFQALSKSNPEMEDGSEAEWIALLLLLIIPAVVYFIIWRSVVYICIWVHVTGYRFNSLQKQWNFLFTIISKMILTLTQPSLYWILGSPLG
jgi:hypothetical protein